MYEDTARTFRLCHGSPLQQGRHTDCIVRIGWLDVGHHAVPGLVLWLTILSRIWNTSDGQCLKTLAEGHDAIWYLPIISNETQPKHR